MQVKTSELTDKALDYAVALCEGKSDCFGGSKLKPYEMCYGLAYSSDWMCGGQIIEREEMGFAKYGPDGTWKAAIGAIPRGQPMFGSTPLIAAMRCYVASKMGEQVEIPDELL